MLKYSVRLPDMESVRDFCNIIGEYAFDAEMRSGREKVDAKSVIGIFSLDLKKPLELTVDADSCLDLPERIFRYLV